MHSLRSPLFSLLAVVLAAAVAAAPARAVEQGYSITDFDRVQIDGPYQVSLTTGRASMAKASGSREAIDRLSVEVQGKTLRVRPNPSAWGGYPGRPQAAGVTIVLSTQNVRAITVNGAGILTADKIKAMRLDIALVGSGRVTVSGVESDSLTATSLGAGTIALGGKAKTFCAEIRGSGSLAAEALTANDAKIVSDTAGTITLGRVRSADVVANASGDVEIAGSPACTVKQIGSGNVRCGLR